MISLLRLEEFDRLRRQSAMENQKRPAINFVDGEQQHLSKATSGYHSYDGSNKSLGKDGCGYGTETIAPFGTTAGDDTHRVTGWTSSDVFPEYKFRRVGEREDIEEEERRVRSRTDFLARRMDTDINMNSISARTLRPSGGKDRHSKVFTAKGPRDRRVRLSVSTAIQFYDVQDRLGYDQPSKAVEWLMKKAKTAIDELSQIPLPGIDRIISQGTSAYPNLSFRGPDTADVRLSDMQQHLDSEAPQFQDKLVTDISMSVGDRSRVYPTTTPHTPEHPREYNPILPSSYMYDMPSQHMQQNHQRMGLLQSPLQYHHHQQTSLVTVQQTYTQQHEFPHNLPFGVVPGNSHNPKQYLKIASGEKHAGNVPTASSSRFSGFLGGSLSVSPEVYTKPPPAPQQHVEQFDGATSSDMMLSLEEQMHRKRS